MPSPSSRAARRLAVACALALTTVAPLALTAAQPAAAQPIRTHGDPSAEAFVQAQADRVLAILGDSSGGAAAKKAAFNTFIDQNADVPRITDFVLGRYRRSLTPEQYARFAEAFRRYADSIYETRLGDYHGERLVVIGSVARSPTDAVVSTAVTGGAYKGNPTVNWRVLKGPGGWKVVDVQAQGVWLAVVEQQDFTSTLANHGGDVDILIRQLQTEATAGRPIGRS